jgi:hypothetical protein
MAKALVVCRDVREIVYDTISKRAGLMNDLQKELHGRIDFAVFDNLVVVIWNLNDRREVQDGEVILSNTEVRKFQRFFHDLAKESDPIHSARAMIELNESVQKR